MDYGLIFWQALKFGILTLAVLIYPLIKLQPEYFLEYAVGW